MHIQYINLEKDSTQDIGAFNLFSVPLRAGGGWWWVPLVATCAGALVGTLIYELLIEIHHPESGSSSEVSSQAQAPAVLELEGVEPDYGLKTPKENGTFL